MQQPEALQPKPAANVLEVPPDFSLVVGGPLYQLYLRTGLARPPLQLVLRRMLVIPAICWAPLWFLAAIGGHLTAGVTDPFLRDPEVHIRFLVALPLLIASEVYVHQRMRTIVAQFPARGIIARQDQPRFEQFVASAMRLRNSAAIELALFILVVTLGHWIWRQKVTLNVSSWYALKTAAGLHLTAAGSYYALVSLSIFRFILVRWYFRLYIWYRFLWQVRALPLHLNLFHPDRAGGLGFLAGSLPALAPVFIAQTALLAGFIYSRILYAGEQLPAFKLEIAGAFLFYVLVIVFPLGFFALHLEEAERKAKREFGTLASHYVDDFRQKWVRGGAPAGEPLLGTADIQSLADLANSYDVVREIHLLPITTQSFLRLVTALALPLLPLTLTVFPLDELIKGLLRLF
ncbi:MAG TPA: hypothetical protein VF532_06345 [Candidatus Angelobacter sp.]